MAQKSIVFLGTSAFATFSLQALAADPAFDVQLVITQPDKPTGRKQTLTAPAVKLVAEELKLPLAQPENTNSQFSILHSQFPRPDFLVVVSYGQILSQAVLDWPSIAPINLHASLLPVLRGASPLQHAVLQGLNESGVTVQKMVKELDAGPILSQTTITLNPRETFTTLHDKLATLGAKLLVETLKKPLKETPQDDSKATFCGKLDKADGVADPSTMTAEQIDRMVRALTPWPGVTINGTKILMTSLAPEEGSMPVPCAKETTLFITKLQPSGGKPMSGGDFLHGNTL